jgi:chemotaxis protein MotB
MRKKYFTFLLCICLSSLVSKTNAIEEEPLDFFYFRSEYAELLRQKKSLEKKLKQTQIQYDKLYKENSELAEKIIAFEEEIVTLHKDTLAYRKEIENKLKHLYAVIDTLNQEKLALELKIQELQKKQNEILTNSKEKLEVQSQKYELEKQTLLEKFRETQIQLENTKKENETLLQKLSQTLEKQKDIETKLQQADLKITELKTNSQENQIREQLQKELVKKIEKEKETQLLELSLRLEQAEREKLVGLVMEGSLASLEEEKEKLKKQNEELSRTVGELRILIQAIEEHEANLLLENEKLKKEIDKLTQTQRKELEKNFNSEIQKGEIQIDQKGKRIVINVSDEITFQPGSAKLKKAGKQTLQKLVNTLRNYNGQKLYIEGNTDDSPIKNSKYLDNWELSTARALSVVRFLIQKGISPKYITAVGNAQYNPIQPNTSETNRAKNRRVDIILAPFE